MIYWFAFILAMAAAVAWEQKDKKKKEVELDHYVEKARFRTYYGRKQVSILSSWSEGVVRISVFLREPPRNLVAAALEGQWSPVYDTEIWCLKDTKDIVKYKIIQPKD